MDKRLLKFSLVCVTGAVLFAANSDYAFAYEEYVAGIPYDNAKVITQEVLEDDTISSLTTNDISIPGFKNTGIANVETNLLIRQGPGEDKKIIAKLPKNGGCEVIGEDDGSGWTKITSGKITGYVKSDYLITGPEASKLALKVGNLIATANTNGLRVRKTASINSEVLDQVALNEELLVLDPLVVTYGEEHNKWVKVSLDSDDSADGTVGYVAKDFVNLSYALKPAFTLEEQVYGSGVSSTRANLINTAKKYLGYRYVWGGTNLNKGVDCSGYTSQIYKLYGYSIPRVSRDQARGGTSISASNLKPGDLVFYGNNSSGYIDHVGIFIGNNKIIHASNKRDGIKISNMYYRKPVKFVRYIRD